MEILDRTHLTGGFVFHVEEGVLEKFTKSNASRRIVHQESSEQILAGRRQFGGARYVDWLFCLHFLQQLFQRLGAIWSPAKKAFVEYAADAPEIGARIVASFEQDLWGHVQWGALDGCGVVLQADVLREAKQLI